MTDNRQKSIPGYLYALDGLRALGLILIVMFHTWQQSWIFFEYKLNESQKLIDLVLFQRYGYVAIDSFFVLSGFCLFYPIARDMFGESKFCGWKEFFIKRARRIYPVYLVLLLLVIIFPIMSQVQYDVKNPLDVAKHVITHIFFIHTWDSATLNSTISTAWTMGIECQFYLMFPLLCVPFKKKPVLTFIGMSAVSVLLRLFLISFEDARSMVVQANPLAYFDVFGSGMLAAYFVVYARNKCKNINKLKLFMTAISVLCIVACYYYICWLSKISFPQGVAGDSMFRFLYRGIFAVLIAGFCFTSTFSYDFWQKKIWGNRFFVFLSGISYAAYLWHQNIYIFLKKANIPYSTSDPVMHDRNAMGGLVLICITATIIISVLVTKYIEKPVVKYGFIGCFKKIFRIEEKQTDK